MNRDSPQSLNEIAFQPPSNRSSAAVHPRGNAPEVPSFASLRSIAKRDQEKIAEGQKIPEKVHLSCKRRYYNAFKSFQKVVYTILEDPTAFTAARVFFYIIFLAIVFTSIDSIVWTTLTVPPTSGPIYYIENTISILFLFEYCCRIFSATAFNQSFFKVMTRPFNLVDLAALLPYFIELGLQDDTQTQTMLKTLRIVRLIKIFRFAKIGRHLKGVEGFFEGVKASVHSFGFLLFLIFVCDLVFATTLYYAENFNLTPDDLASDTRINTLLDSMWWACATITTVGYGDFVPNTPIGKIIGSIIAVCGMLMLSLPVAILGISFQKTFAIQLDQELFEAEREAAFKMQEEKHGSKRDDSKKEIDFMKERIKKIKAKNEKIMKLLAGSQGEYQSVADALMHLYRSVYADEKEEEKNNKEEGVRQDPSAAPALIQGTKLEMRIKLYEKLNRVKKKISAANVFQKVKLKAAMSRACLGTTTENERQATDRDLLGTESSLLKGSPRKEIIEEDLSENPGDLKLIKSNVKKSPLKTLHLSQTNSPNPNAQEESDLLEADGDDIFVEIPVLETEVNISHANTYKRMFDNYRERINHQEVCEEAEELELAFGIKCHSERGENDFLRYYLEYLRFVPQTLLDNLLACPTEGHQDPDSDGGDDSDSENGEEKLNQQLKGNNIQLSDRNPYGLPDTGKKSKSQPLLLRHKRRGSLDSRSQKLDLKVPDAINKLETVRSKFAEWKTPQNFDPSTWELTGKIIDNIEKKKNRDEVERIENEILNGGNNQKILRRAITQPKTESQKMKELLRIERQNKFEDWIKEYKNDPGNGRMSIKDLKLPGTKKKKQGNVPTLQNKDVSFKKLFEEKLLPPIQEDDNDDIITPFSDKKTGSFRSRLMYVSTIIPE